MRRYSENYQSHIFLNFKLCQKCGLTLSSNDYQNEANFCFNCVQSQRFSNNPNSWIIFSKEKKSKNEYINQQCLLPHPSDPPVSFLSYSSDSSNLHLYHHHHYRSSPNESYSSFLKPKVFDWPRLEVNKLPKNNEGQFKEPDSMYDAETIRQMLDSQPSEVSPYEDDQHSENNSVIMEISNSEEPNNDTQDATPEYEYWLEEALKKSNEVDKIINNLESKSNKTNLKKNISKLKKTNKRKLESFSASQASLPASIELENVKCHDWTSKKKIKKKNRNKKIKKKVKPFIKLTSSPYSSLNADNESYLDNQSSDLAISDLLENGLENVSFEQLVKHYNDIQRQLEELSKEEEKNNAKHNKINEKDEKETSKKINNHYEEMDANNTDDDDLIQLRLLALSSKKKIKSQEQTCQLLDNKKEETTISFKPSAFEDKDLDEEQLRATLFQSIVSKKNNNVVQETNKAESFLAVDQNESIQQVSENLTSTNSVFRSQHSSIISDFIPNLNTSFISQNLISDIPMQKFIINFGEDSSADDEEDKKNFQEECSPMLSNLESFLREAKLKSSKNFEPENDSDSKPILNSSNRISKLSLAQKKKLKETQALGGRALLNLKEAKWKQMKNNINQNKIKLDSLKLQISNKQLNLRKAQIHAKKMHDLYLEATKQVSRKALELNQLNQNLKTISLYLEEDKKLSINLSKECIKLGFQIEGETYKLPSQKKETIFCKLNGNNETKNKSNEELTMQKKKLKGLEKAVSKRLHDMQSTSALKTVNATKLKIFDKADEKLNLKSNADQTEAEKSVERRKRFEIALKKFITTCFTSFENNIIYVPFLNSLQYLTYQLSSNLECSIFSSFFYESHFNSSEDTSHQSLFNSFSGNTFTSGLAHLHAYRLSQCYDLFAKKHLVKPDYLSPSYSNAIHPHKVICHYDLMGTCNDDNCTWQHKDSYLLGTFEKLVEILTYNPSVSGYTEKVENTEKMREHLKIFVDQFRQAKGSLGDEEIEQIVNLVRKSISSPISASQRVIPRFEFSNNDNNFSIHTFDDFKYNIKTRDRNLVLTYGKIYRIKTNVDPDIYIKNRFFAPEGRPISAELETTLASEPHNVRLWLNLAYYHVTRSPNKKSDCINRALNVLSRALECNRFNLNNSTKDDWDRNWQLWEHFLLLYANRVVPLDEAPEYQLLNICKQAIAFCPDYKVWRQYLSLCVSFKKKDSVSNEFLNAISLNIIHFENESHESNSILELVFYKVQLYLEAGQKIQANTLLRKYLLNQYKFADKIFQSPLDLVYGLFEDSENSIQVIKCILGCRLTSSDRVYAWLCYIHLLYTGNLPYNIFESFGPGYCKLSQKKTFSIEWNSSLTSEKKIKLINVFYSSLQDCLKPLEHINDKYLKNSLPLLISLVTLEPFSLDSLKLFNCLQSHFPNCSCLWILKADIETRLGHPQIAVKILKNSPAYQKSDVSILFLISILFYKLNQFEESFLELKKVVSSYFDRELHDSEIKSAFDLLMTDNSTLDHPLRSFLKCKIIEKTVNLDLCYFLFQLMTINSNKDMEYLFNTSLNICKLGSETDIEIQFSSFWCLYIHHFLQNIRDQKEYKESVTCLRHCCLSISDHFFQVKFIKCFSQPLSDQIQKFNFMIDFVKLLPENMLLLTQTIELGLKLDEREKCYDLFKYFFINKRYKRFEAIHWKSIICLAIDCNDNLNAHRYFQLALSNNPYNCGLWKLMLTYETSLNHENHIKEAKKILTMLELPLTSKQR